jgi:hypothetical protein
MSWTLTHPGPDARSLETDHASREDDPTPRGVVRAALAAAVNLESMPDVYAKLCAARMFADAPEIPHVGPLRVLDVCAGYGCWASELRRLAALQGWPVHITGVELFEPRRAVLEKWCDEVVIGDWHPDGCVYRRPTIFDLVIGNPHFTALTHEDPEQSMPAVLLRHAPAVLLYHSVNTFQRGVPGRAVYRATRPAAKWLVPGTVSHDGTSSVASDCYQVTLWLRGHDGPCSEYLLDVEPEDANRDAGILKRGGAPYKCWRWTVPPGSEDPSSDLPAAPGWAP